MGKINLFRLNITFLLILVDLIIVNFFNNNRIIILNLNIFNNFNLILGLIPIYFLLGIIFSKYIIYKIKNFFNNIRLIKSIHKINIIYFKNRKLLLNLDI